MTIGCVPLRTSPDTSTTARGSMGGISWSGATSKENNGSE
jgi:hypothetical protein